MSTFKVKGREVSVDGPASVPLLWASRDDIGLTGTRCGCGMACHQPRSRPASASPAPLPSQPR